MDVSCQCGAIKFKTPTTKPLSLYHCHCSRCRHQSASAFGTSAIFEAFPPLVPLSDEFKEKLSCYTQPTKSGAVSKCYFCKNCGVRIFHDSGSSDDSGKQIISIKGGCIEGLDWPSAQHIWVESAVVPIPLNAERWEQSPEPEARPAESQSKDS